ncbi:thiamine pyrophosphate-binding protein [Amycolatopsis palatopharyngis]|uniref:thiamine pyrophosphate-binding protein n=1 Tax=Amycolatopsis palatopharyngis TaxID=187982 RepID=UPI000E240CAB|nr:thiamine pyrophosphate-binding protein [Amycolatopsis palatopharyngis]
MTRDLALPLVRGLRAAGVEKIFGMPGGGPNLDMIGCAEEVGIDFVLAHGETAACIMAASYGRLTGTPGVAVVTRGPGLTSAGNGLAQATLDRFPLLLISDTVSQANAGRVAHQRLDQVGAAAPLTKWSGTLGVGDPEAVVNAAAALATAAPAGAVHLAFDPTVAGDPAPELPMPAVVDDAVLERVRRRCDSARRPVVIVGLDAARHVMGVRAALESMNCPILVTYEAKGTIPESWPSYAGVFTGAVVERPLLDQADLIIALGLDPVEPLPGPWSNKAPMVMLHSHPIDAAYFGEPEVVVGSYDEQFKDLLGRCHSEWPPRAGRETCDRDVARLEYPTQGLSPHEVVRTTRKARGDALLTVDAGAHMLVAMPLWETDDADSVLISNGLATMGFSLPAAIGAALARPGQRVVCFVGDGGLAMVLAELETLARLRLDVTVVVLNDEALTLIRLKQKQNQGGDMAVVYGAMDFAAVACGMGVPGSTVDDAESLRVTLDAAGPGPSLVDARIDPSGYAHVMRVTRG